MNELNFSAEYSQLSEDELLLLASDRTSLKGEAATALEAELRRRNLTQADQAKYQQFVKHSERREARRRRRRILGTGRDRLSLVDLFWTLLALALISFTYAALPSRYHLKPDWQESAMYVMFASVPIAIISRDLWRKTRFWISLAISSSLHLAIVHACIRPGGNFSRGWGRLAFFLGFLLFFTVYGIVWVLRQKLYGDLRTSQAPSERVHHPPSVG